MLNDKNNWFTPQMRNRLKTTAIGLGLVQLLMDVGWTDEAKTTLVALQNGLDEESQMATARPCGHEDSGHRDDIHDLSVMSC